MTAAAAMVLGVVAAMAQVPAPAHADPSIVSPTAVVVGAGKRAIVVSWTAPVAQAVDHYVASAGAGLTCKTATTTCTIPDPLASTPYTVTVTTCTTASDVNNCSNPSVPSASVTPGPPGIPDTLAVAYHGTPDKVTVSWHAPSSVGAGIESYRVTPSPAPPPEATGSCTALVPVGTTSCDFDGLTVDTSYTFKVIAVGTTTNALSSGSSLASGASAAKVIGLPHQPAAPTVEWAGPDSLTVSWQKPSGGPPIGSYTVTDNPAGGTSPSCGTNLADLSCTFTGLDQASAYTFQVAANGVGTGSGSSAPSTASSPMTSGTAAVPGAPTVDLGSVIGTATVSWDAPTSGGTPLSYTVTPSGGAGPTSPGCGSDPSVLSCAFTGLVAGTSYTFTVASTTAAGTSAASAPSAAVVSDPAAAPGTPTAVLGDAPGKATVTWPARSTGGSVTGYVVTPIPGGGGGTGTRVAGCGFNLAAPSCSFTGLDPTKSYTFTVTAIGDIGSATSAASNAIIPDKPGAPTAPTVTLSATPGSLDVTWTAPAAGGVPTSYTVTPTSTNGGTPLTTCTITMPNTLTCPFTGLDQTKLFGFTVSAINAAGHAEAATTTQVVPAAPGAPTAVTVTPAVSPGTATVHWTPGAGGAAASYTVTASPAPTSGSADCAAGPSATSCTFTNLVTTQAYTFIVTATNLSGSSPSGASAATVANVPNAPTAPTVTLSATPGSLDVTWTAPAAGGTPTSYTVTPTSTNGGTPLTVCTVTMPNTLTCPFTGLDQTKLFAFTVSAINDLGHAEASPTTEVVPAKPGVPTAVTVSLGTNTPGTATVHWTPGVGAPATGYTVTPTPALTSGATECTAGAGATSCTFTNLVTTTPYTFIVTATNASGSSYSAASASTVADVPGAPTGVAVALGVGGPTEVTVTWAAPVGGAAVDSYSVSATDGVTPVTCTPNPATALTCTYPTLFSGLTGGTPYTFVVTATNAAGSMDSSPGSSTVPDVPGAPTAVTAALVASTPGSVTVTWGAPGGGGVVDRYTVTASSDGGTTPSACTVLLAATKTCTFSSLSLPNLYTFTVSAINTAGHTETASTPTVMPDKPGMPTAVAAALVAATPRSMVVTWNAPTSGGAVVRYEVTGSSTDGGTPPTMCTVTDLNARTCTFTLLDQAKLYAFTVSAINVAGHSEASPTAEVVPDKPGAPTAVTVALGATPGTATVSWGAPAGGGVVTGYVVTPSPNTITPSSCSAIASARSCDFEDLDSSTPYTFVVAAVGVAGHSDATVGPLVASKPGAPGTPTVVATASGVVTVTWTAPSTGGPVVDYTVAASAAPTSSAACDHVLVGTVTCSFSGLTPATSYTFRVTANGIVGGTESAASAAIVPGPPSAPTVPSVALAGPNAVRVSWTAPGGGGPLTGYSVASNPPLTAPVGCTNVAALTCVFDHLASGTPYLFTVTATGPSGSSSPIASASPIIPGPPDTPGKPTATLTGVSGEVQVSWAAPSAGAGIAGYSVQSASGAEVCTSNSPSTTSCVAPSLSGANLTFRVQAIGITDSGNSPFSPLSDPITPGAVGAPAMPGTPVAVAIGVARVSVSWTMPSTVGPVTSYLVTAVQPASGGPAACTTLVLAPCVFTGLDTTVAYQFRVTAIGPQGSTQSGLSNVVTPATPRTPGTPAVLLTGPGTATISWAAPSGGGPVTRYKLTSNQSVADLAACGADPSILQCLVTGLNSALSYTFQVEAHGPLGDTMSAASTAVVPAAPGAPVDPTVVLTAVGEATVSWTAPATGGPLTGYTLTSTPGTMSLPGGCGAGQPVTSCHVTGLTPTSSYTFHVTANGPLGSPSVNTSAVVPDLPGTPATATAVIGAPGTATVNWTAPTVGAGPVISYSVTSNPVLNPPDGCTLKNVTSCVFTGLDPAVAYTFSVRANGPFGSGAAVSATPVTTGAPSTPGTPNVQVTAAGTVLVSWAASPSGGGPRTGYTVTSDPATTSPCVNAPATTCSFTGLDPATEYTFLVTANGPAVSTPSVSRSKRIIPGVPAQPGKPTVQVTAPGVVTVSWAPPSASAGPLTGYTVATSDSVLTSPCTGLGLTCDFPVPGAGPYSFVVTAVGPGGTTPSPASSLISVVAPGAPGVPVAVVTGPGAVHLTWTASGGGPVTGYTVSSTSATAPAACINTSALACDFTGLGAGAYTFRVTANGPAGATASAAYSDPVTPGAPGAPGTPIATVTSPTSVRVVWTASSGGGPLSGYTVTSVPAVTPPNGCIGTAELFCDFSGLSAVQPYTFLVTAKGPAGSTDSAGRSGSANTAVPGAPSTPTAQVRSSGVVRVTWSAPSSGGPLTGYSVTSDPAVGSSCVTVSTYVCDFSGLDQATPYTFSVTANGPAGGTPSVARSVAVVPGAPGAPGQPTGVVTAPGVMSLSWTPSAGGGPLTKYSVTSGSVAPPACTDVVVPHCDFPITDAGPFTFVVTAAGPGGTAAPVAGSPISVVKPGAPGTPTAVVTAAGTVRVTWTASTGGLLTGYSVSSSPSVTAPGACLNTSALRCDFTGLGAGPYTFLVTANSVAGGTASAESGSVTVAAPAAPTALSATVTSPTSARVVWTASSGGGPLTGYTVTSIPAVTPPNGCLGTSELSCDFAGLSPAQPYTFVVTANGPAGNTPSAATAVAISTALPGAPGTPTAEVRAAGTVRVTWTASPNGGPPANYTVTSDPVASSSCVNVAGPMCEFTDLDQTKSYTFLVTANGPAGGTPSVARSAAVMPGAPGKPGRPTVQVTAPNVVSVSWAPSVGGGPLTRYSVTSGSVAPPACTDLVVLNCDFPVSGEGPFTFTVTAAGPGGTTASDASLPIAVVKPGAPGTPTAVVTAAGTVRVTWAASTGGLLTGYSVSSSPSVTAPGACLNTSALRCDFTGLGAGPYTFLVTANSVAGSTDSVARSGSVTVAAPGAPGTPTATVTSPTSARVVWPASSGGGPLTGYTVTSDPAITPPNGCLGASELFCDYSGLSTGQAYTFLVSAKGPAGTTDSAVRSAAVTPTATTSTTLEAPGKPTAAQIDVNTAVRVSWAAPGAGAGIASYTVLSTPGGFGCDTATTTCVVSGLTSTTSYTFQVRAVGVANGGASGWSPASDAIVPATLAAPTNVNAVGANHQIAVSWTRPTGAGVVSYLATASPGGATCTAVAAESECLIGSLTNGSSYTVTVVAVAANTALNSVPSAASVRAQPTAGVPGTATGVKAAAGDGSAAISWVAPTWVGDGILSYIATATGSPDGQYCVSAGTACTITGLTNGNDYQITVVAIGRYASGNSAPSTPVVVQPRPDSAVPTAVTVTPGALTLGVQFAPGNTVANVTGYTATAVAGASSLSCTTAGVSTMSCVITGVTAGKSYAVTVAANMLGGGSSTPSTPAKTVMATNFGAPVLPAAVPTGTAIYGPLTSPAAGTFPVGSSATVSGTLYSPFTAITVGIYSSTGSAPVVLGTAVTDVNGTFSLSVPITGVSAGSYTIVAAGMRTATVVRYRSVAVTVTGIAA